MHDYQQQFIDFALSHQVLKFGEFQLKSGRISPYFFNAGLFNSGKALAQLGQFYAAAIQQADIDFDVLFGPAYKGIPLASSCAVALANEYQRDIGYSFNRKEAKDHGEGGNIVGAALQGNVLIIDDVITAGTAIREAMQIIEQHNAKAAGIVIALDRQERGQGDTSAIQEIEQTYQIPVIPIIRLEHLVHYLNDDEQQKTTLEAIYQYREQYGI